MEDWYFVRDGFQHGPIARETLLHGLSTGYVNSSTLVWTSTLVGWTPIQEVNGLLLPVQNSTADFVQYASTDDNARLVRANIGLIVVGYFASVGACVGPFPLGVVGLVIGIILRTRGIKSHGLAILVTSALCGAFGIFCLVSVVVRYHV